jgi:hypothetical protein
VLRIDSPFSSRPPEDAGRREKLFWMTSQVIQNKKFCPKERMLRRTPCLFRPPWDEFKFQRFIRTVFIRPMTHIRSPLRPSFTFHQAKYPSRLNDIHFTSSTQQPHIRLTPPFIQLLQTLCRSYPFCTAFYLALQMSLAQSKQRLSFQCNLLTGTRTQLLK